MATTSEVKAGLDEVATRIKNARRSLTQHKLGIEAQRLNLAAIPTDYADLIAEITGYTPTEAFETLAKDEMERLTTEFQALRAEAASAVTDLAAYTEF